MDRTNSKSDTPLAQRRSVSVPVFIITSPTGNPFGPFTSAKEAVAFAEKHWPCNEIDVQRLWSPEEVQMIPEYVP